MLVDLIFCSRLSWESATGWVSLSFSWLFAPGQVAFSEQTYGRPAEEELAAESVGLALDFSKASTAEWVDLVLDVLKGWDGDDSLGLKQDCHRPLAKGVSLVQSRMVSDWDSLREVG